MLELRGVTKIFPGVRALDGVDFTLRAGEIHTLMGENGAGKSTLIKVLTGVYPRDVSSKDSGTMSLDGREIHPRSPREAEACGIATVYQEVNLIAYRSVAENFFLGRQPRKFGLIDWSAMRAGAKRGIGTLGLDLDVSRPLESFSLAIQQLVAIGRAIDTQAKVLVLDEPTSSLDTREVNELFAVLRRLRDDGMGIVFVSHFLDQVYAISDRITVLRNGKFIGEYRASELPRLELVGKMIGKDASSVAAMQHPPAAVPTRAAQQRPVLAAEGLGLTNTLKPFTLTIAPGEVVGLAGLLGSGRTETARLLFGADTASKGTLAIDGQRVRPGRPRATIAGGLGFCPEDRKTQAIIPDLSVRENIALALQAKRGWWRRLSRRAQNELAAKYIRALNIATSDAEKPIKLLSGGNQQKAILGRWLAAQPKLLILDEPTRGIDVGAKAEIEKLVAQLCAEGMSILFISSELEEVARTSHRVIVVRDREHRGELTGADRTVERIVQLIAGDGVPA